jgi:hypothetical protein
MRRSRIFGTLVLASVAMVVVPAAEMAQSTTDKMEQKAKGAMQDLKTGMQDAKIGMSDSWLTGFDPGATDGVMGPRRPRP